MGFREGDSGAVEQPKWFEGKGKEKEGGARVGVKQGVYRWRLVSTSASRRKLQFSILPDGPK